MTASDRAVRRQLIPPAIAALPRHRKVTAMRNLFAAVYFLLALFGCESGGTPPVNHPGSKGVGLIPAKTPIKAGGARFQGPARVNGGWH